MRNPTLSAITTGIAAALVFAAVQPATAGSSTQSCWGQATRAFAQQEPGILGDHSSGFETPRLGLRNLARSLHETAILDDDTMQALGEFVADELDLAIEACRSELE